MAFRSQVNFDAYRLRLFDQVQQFAVFGTPTSALYNKMNENILSNLAPFTTSLPKLTLASSGWQ